MEFFTLEIDIKVFCETAISFPDGIVKAHQELRSIVPFSAERRYFGISRPNEKGVIIYKAATEEIYQGEAQEFGCETFTIERGQYISILIKDYIQNIQKIGKAVESLTAYPDADPDSGCIEFYLNDKDVRCMIKLNS
jgi:hypothetical protein